MKPMTYRKKPVEVQAIKFVYSAEGIAALKDFCGDQLITFGKDRSLLAVGWAQIGTLEDGKDGQAKHIADEGDFIIRGVQGEFYPCKPDIFDKTYERVNYLDTSKFGEFPIYAPNKDYQSGFSSQCPKCGIVLSSVMSYTCQNINCPTGLGGSYSGTVTVGGNYSSNT